MEVRFRFKSNVSYNDIKMYNIIGLIYCMEYLVSHIDWLETKIKALDTSTYLLFDCPGQVRT
jgi:hypothetical protein